MTRMIQSGCLILVVGPSGAGKDTLIEAAARRFSTDPRFLFPRRVVSRPPGSGEDNEFLDAATINWLAEEGAFALHWHAHGLSYAIPKSVEASLIDGACVVCNVSRAIVDEARRKYNCYVVEVSASQDTLLRRLSNRQRPSDGDLGLRIQRATALEITADFRLMNDDAIDIGIAKFCQILIAVAESVAPAASVITQEAI